MEPLMGEIKMLPVTLHLMAGLPAKDNVAYKPVYSFI
jgi:hypothetical protein